jgi:O-antigen/teichoic acid export membrane protein
VRRRTASLVDPGSSGLQKADRGSAEWHSGPIDALTGTLAKPLVRSTPAVDPLIHLGEGRSTRLNLHPRLTSLRSRVRVEAASRFLRAASWVISDQALISATNFLGMVIAARLLSTVDFGTYALAYTAIWALNGVQSSLITQPHSVLASHDDLVAYRRYTSATGLMQLALSFGLGIPILFAGVVALVAGAGPLLVVVGFALIAWQAQEFLRRILYFEGRLAAVVALDVISYGGQFVAILVLAWAGSFTVDSGLAAAGVTSGVAAILGLILLRKTLFHRPLPGAVGQNIAHGRWLLGAELGFTLCTSAYPFVLAATHGPESVAVYAAATLVLNPLNVLWFAVGTAVPIQLSRSRQRHGDHVARGDLLRIYAGSIPIVGGYCLVAAVFGGPLLGYLFEHDYAQYGWVVAAAALTRFLSFHSHLLSVGLRVHGQTRAIFVGYAAAVPFSLIVGSALTVAFGIAGAMVAIFGSHVIWTTIWARAYRAGDPTPVEGPTASL